MHRLGDRFVELNAANYGTSRQFPCWWSSQSLFPYMSEGSLECYVTYLGILFIFWLSMVGCSFSRLFTMNFNKVTVLLGLLSQNECYDSTTIKAFFICDSEFVTIHNLELEFVQFTMLYPQIILFYLSFHNEFIIFFFFFLVSITMLRKQIKNKKLDIDT